jgi:hypothetical protein
MEQGYRIHKHLVLLRYAIHYHRRFFGSHPAKLDNILWYYLEESSLDRQLYQIN